MIQKKIYLANTEPFRKEGLSFDMDSKRREKAEAQKTAGGRARSLAAGWLLYAVQKEAGMEGCRVAYEPSGKPFFPESSASLSLSHSGVWAAAAFSEGAVGIDIQQIVPVRPEVYRRVLEEKEMAEFRMLHGTEAEKNVRFLGIWAVKESYMKLTGAGMSLGFGTIRAAEDGTVRRSEDGSVLAYYRQYPAPAGYVLAACAEREDTLPEAVSVLAPEEA